MFNFNLSVKIYRSIDIKECVQSVLSQTYKDWELILVDDGSTDCSGTFCDQFAQVDSRISVIHQENAGVTRARAKGVFSSTGNFVYFLDADDTIENDTLEYTLDLHPRITDKIERINL